MFSMFATEVVTVEISYAELLDLRPISALEQLSVNITANSANIDKLSDPHLRHI